MTQATLVPRCSCVRSRPSSPWTPCCPRSARRSSTGASLREQLQGAAARGSDDAALAPVGLLAGLAGPDARMGRAGARAAARRARLVRPRAPRACPILAELNNAYRGTALRPRRRRRGRRRLHRRALSRRRRSWRWRSARASGSRADQLRNLEFGALLHDVGKVAIPKEIINKPGKLDADEWQIIKTHTIEGQRMLDRVGGFMSEVGRIVRSHHERWDGGGYPDGLAGEAIPLEARIIAACDSWNAMTTTPLLPRSADRRGGAGGAHRLLRHPVRPPRRRHPARHRVRRHPNRRAEPVGRGGLATGSKCRRFSRAVVIGKRAVTSRVKAILPLPEHGGVLHDHEHLRNAAAAGIRPSASRRSPAGFGSFQPATSRFRAGCRRSRGARGASV